MDGRLPTTIQEAEALVLALYEPAPPEAIARIQEVLHRLQRSPSGWWIARDLLSHNDDKVKFFGALTLIVKLNTESSSLDSNDASELLQNLVGWFVKSLDDGSGALVIRKLSSALVTFFLHFPTRWESCIRHLCWSLSEGAHLSQERISPTSDLSGLLQSLHPRKLQAALWFSGTLVDESSKVEMNSAKHSGLYNSLMSNAPDALALMSYVLNHGTFADPADSSIRRDSMTCLQSWVWFSQRVSSQNDELVASLRTLIQPTIVALGAEDLYEVAVELLADVLSNYSVFLTESHYESLFSLFETQWSHERYRRLVEGDFDFDSIQYGQLMISLGDSKVQSLIHSVDNRSSNFLARLRGLLSAHGYPVSEDKIFVPALEFWSTYVETLTDCIYSDSDSKAWVSSATSHVLEAVSTATFVSLKDPDKGAQATIDHAVAQLGPMIAQSIIQNIGGNASRSELDRLGEPLKKMVSNQVKARAWLEQALFDPSFPGQHISSEEKAVFLKKIIKSVLFFDNISLRMRSNH
ncbi:Importin beta-like protein kap111 [Colletotrichum tropicale]|nr:Importin beta-like protein kap111 [Colletotrichum tropicale]